MSSVLVVCSSCVPLAASSLGCCCLLPFPKHTEGKGGKLPFAKSLQMKTSKSLVMKEFE